MTDKPTIPASLYTREYYLTDNEGHEEYNKGLDLSIHDKFKRIFELVKIPPQATILDIGCGRGELIYYCIKQGAYKAYGIDYSQDAINIANETKKRLPEKRQKQVFFSQSTAEDYPYKKKYDCIFMIETAEHMYDWQLQETFQKIKKSLKPDGIMLITTPNHSYEEFLQPIKMILNMPFRFFKLLFRIPRGKYKPKSVKEFFARVLRIKPGRGEINEKMHGNVMTPKHLRELLVGFDAKVFCEDPSLNPLSLLLKKWYGRQLYAIAKLKK